MNISYGNIKSYSKDKPSIMLAEDGNYFLPNIDSRYQGFYIYTNGRMLKVMDSILSKKKITSIKNNFYSVEQKRGKSKEAYWLYKDSLIMEQEKPEQKKIILDIRDSYDNREWGRHYEIEEEKDIILIKFTKYTSHLEDDSDGEKEYEIYLAISGKDIEYKISNKWIKKEYSMDMKRNSPSERYVCDSVDIKSEKVVFSVAHDRKSAIKFAKSYLKNLTRIKKSIVNKYEKKSVKKINNKELKLAFKATSNSLDQLIVEDKGIFAGLPWFFQFWSRDELISLKAVMINGDFKLAKKILMRNLDSIGEDGRLLNQTLPISGNTNADAVGWLFKRIQDYEEMKGFTKKEKSKIKVKLLSCIKRIKENYMENSMIKNNSLETWMDSEWGGDNRSGFNIEIQSMFLNMLKMAYDLTGNKSIKEEELDMRRIVKERFKRDKYFSDSAYEDMVRPNIFIAAYIYPTLMSKKEWTSVLGRTLKNLWLPWGGLSSIDKKHPLFMKFHTGEVPQSYHRGDSWFWINDLVALTLYRLDKVLFKKYIEKIIKADIEEIMLKGVTGAHSELSSAKKLESNGCFNQAWSNAMFIELVEEINSFYPN